MGTRGLRGAAVAAQAGHQGADGAQRPLVARLRVGSTHRLPPFRILTIVDDCIRKSLALVADSSLSGIRVARELDRLTVERGKPRMVVSDNGSELTINAILSAVLRNSSKTGSGSSSAAWKCEARPRGRGFPNSLPSRCAGRRP